MAVELGFGLIRGLVTGTYLANINASIKDMVDAFEQWRWHLFEQLVPASVLLQIAAVKASYGLRVSDKLCWGVTMNKQFAQLMGFGWPLDDLNFEICRSSPLDWPSDRWDPSKIARSPVNVMAGMG
ncbi:hypothetical protein V6N12_038217 [Hibiscus sabdariffa]|uniref:Uncharacterized protein n=1 Tax=Hibiscus sabdariffa TaxID=183260 RepID=A0ABR2BX31_9ROSI